MEETILDHTEKPKKKLKGLRFANTLFCSFFMLSFLLSILHFPGKTAFLILSTLGFMVVNLISIFTAKNTIVKFLHLLGLKIPSFYAFKFMFWPGAINLELMSIIICPVALVLYFLTFKKENNDEPYILYGIKYLFTPILLIICYFLPPQSFYYLFMGKDQIEAELYQKCYEEKGDKSYKAFMDYKRSTKTPINTSPTNE
jgi:hypothetical protein